MASMPRKGIAGGGGGSSGATRGDMTTSRQMRGKQEGGHHRFCASLHKNTTQQSNGIEALADMRCRRVRGGVASRKGQSTGVGERETVGTVGGKDCCEYDKDNGSKGCG